MGVTQFDATVGGLGGCPFAGQKGAAGNICTEELALLCEEMGIATTAVPMGDYPALEAAIQPGRTRYLISESPTNPFLRAPTLSRAAGTEGQAPEASFAALRAMKDRF